MSREHALVAVPPKNIRRQFLVPQEKIRSATQPQLSPLLKRLIEEAQKMITPSINDEDYDQIIERVCQKLGVEITHYELDILKHEFERAQAVFGPLQPLVDDVSISDIIITDYSKVEVQEGRCTFTTGISFYSQEAYEAFVEKLLLKAGTTISTKHPIADGMIGSFARIHAVHKCLCESGPYLTIRLNRFGTVTLHDLIASGSAPFSVFDYLSKIASAGYTIMVAGEVGTGKTTLLRALAANLPEADSVLVIEDTPEIRLSHPHVRYLSTREANSEGEGKISPAECIRGGMRMAMNRIIFGEIRDAEAAEAFLDVCASGHPGMSTVHAKSATDALARLELFLGRIQKGATRNVLMEQVSGAIAVIVYCDVCKVSKRRRITEVREVGPVADGAVRQREIFHYDNAKGDARWLVTGRASFFRAALESGESPLALSALPSSLEVGEEILEYKKYQ